MTTTEVDLTDALLAEFIDDPDALNALDSDELAAVLQYLTNRMTSWSFDKPGFVNEKALIAEQMLQKVDWTLAGGAAGGGKSELGLKHAYELSLDHQAHATLILRTSKPELQRSLVMRSVARFMQMRAPARLRTVDNVKAWHFENHSTIEFGYCARLEDVGQYLSAEYQFIWPDESTQFLVGMLLAILARLRTTVGSGIRPHALLTTNPGDRSHAWHKEVFVDPTARGDYIVVYNVEEGIDARNIVRRIPAPQTVAEAEAMEPVDVADDEIAVAFVPFKSVDNPYLDRSYRRMLSALPEIERKQKRDGDWDMFSGKFFTEWSFDVHTVPDFQIPAGWARARALDWGFRAPYCCLWGAWDQDGNCWVYREDYGTELTTAQQAHRVTSRSTRFEGPGRAVPERITRTAADPATFSATGTGDSIAMQWQKAGLFVTKANNDRTAGWANVRDYLRPVRQADGTDRPRLHVFRSCENLIRTLPLQQYAKESEDLDTDQEDHAVDALRYLLMLRPVTRLREKARIRDGLEGLVDLRFAKARRASKTKKGRF